MNDLLKRPCHFGPATFIGSLLMSAPDCLGDGAGAMNNK
jgi:hypothetical protein